MTPHELFGLMGFPRDMKDGAYVWNDNEPSADVIQAACDLSGKWLATDLGASPCKALSAWSETLKAKQCEDIRRLRRDAYRDESDGLMFEAQYDKSDEKMAEWRKKVDEIKARYPWPGEYR